MTGRGTYPLFMAVCDLIVENDIQFLKGVLFIMREFYFPWSTRIPTPLKMPPPEVLQALEDRTDEEIDAKIAAHQKKFDDRIRSWLSNYGDDGLLLPGTTLSPNDYSMEQFMLCGVEPEDEAAYIVSEKRRLGVL